MDVMTDRFGRWRRRAESGGFYHSHEETRKHAAAPVRQHERETTVFSVFCGTLQFVGY